MTDELLTEAKIYPTYHLTKLKGAFYLGYMNDFPPNLDCLAKIIFF